MCFPLGTIFVFWLLGGDGGGGGGGGGGTGAAVQTQALTCDRTIH